MAASCMPEAHFWSFSCTGTPLVPRPTCSPFKIFHFGPGGIFVRALLHFFLSGRRAVKLDIIGRGGGRGTHARAPTARAAPLHSHQGCRIPACASRHERPGITRGRRAKPTGRAASCCRARTSQAARSCAQTKAAIGAEQRGGTSEAPGAETSLLTPANRSRKRTPSVVYGGLRRWFTSVVYGKGKVRAHARRTD